MRSTFSKLTLFLVALASVSCSPDATSGVDSSRVMWIDVLPASYSLTDLGVPISFTPLGEDGSGTPLPADRFDWSSSAPEIVTMETSSGIGTVFGYGAATVTAAAGGQSGAAVLLSGPDRWSTDARVDVVSRSDAIMGAVLGVGPITASGIYYGCSYPGLWTSFPRGTRVTVRVSTTVGPVVQDAIGVGLDQVADVTGGALTTTFEVTSQAVPVPRANEVTVTAHPRPSAFGCRRDVGCTLHEFAKPGVLRSSRVVLPANQTPNAFVHDAVGHGILGMCHLDSGRIGNAEHSLMSNGPFTNSSDIAPVLSHLDREVERAVWRSSLDPGADARAFRRAGLIRP